MIHNKWWARPIVHIINAAWCVCEWEERVVFVMCPWFTFEYCFHRRG